MFEIYIRLRINLEIKSESIDRDSVSWSTEVCNLLQSDKLGLTHLGLGVYIEGRECTNDDYGRFPENSF